MLTEAWSSLEAAVPEWAIVILGTFIVHELAFVLANVPYLLADHWGVWQQWKIHNFTVPLDDQWAQFRRLLKGHCFELLPLTALGYPLLAAVGFTASADTLPSWRKAAVQFLVFNAIEDTGFYWVRIRAKNAQRGAEGDGKYCRLRGAASSRVRGRSAAQRSHFPRHFRTHCINTLTCIRMALHVHLT